MPIASGETVAGAPTTKSVKRTFLGVVVVASVVVVAIASAATTKTYRGTVGGGGAIHFRVAVTNADTVEVRGLRWRHVRIRCRQGRFPFRGGFVGESFPVESGRFHARGNAGTTYVSHAKVVGQLRKHGRRAAGTLRIRGDLDAHHENCHSGLRRWWAKRVG